MLKAHACTPDILVISLIIGTPVKPENPPLFALVLNITTDSFTFVFNSFISIYSSFGVYHLLFFLLSL